MAIGAPNIIVVDHVSWLDAPILFSLMELPTTFVIEPAAARSWPAQLCLRSASARVLDPAKALALRALVRDAKRGRRLVLFLDTRAAVAGQSMASFDVAALIAEKSGAAVTAVRLAGAERAFFSRIATVYALAVAWIVEDQGHRPAAAAASHAIWPARSDEAAGAAPRPCRPDGRTPVPHV